MSTGNPQPPTPDPAREDPDARLARILAEHALTGDAVAPEAPAQEEGSHPDPLIDPLAAADSEHRAGHPTEDSATGDATRDAPLFRLLSLVEAEVGVERIDRVWLFPPRRIQAGETSVVVVAAYADPAGDRRRVLAAHYTAPADAPEPRLRLDEFGSAPADRLGRMVEEAVERLKEDLGAAPRAVRIDGDLARWLAMVHELAERHLEEAMNPPRRRRYQVGG